MKRTLTALILTLISTQLTAQQSGEDAILQEGTRLYKSEMASWYGTNVFLKRFPEKVESLGGYFSYADGDTMRCVLFSNVDSPKVIAVISFGGAFDIETASVSGTERQFTSRESDLYEIRKAATKRILSDTLFKSYGNTRLNLIPLIEGDSRMVYALTGPQQSGVVIFGNDYLLTFDSANVVLSARAIHGSMTTVQYSEEGKADDMVVHVTRHVHSSAADDAITPTDVCTLMLYGKFAKWKQHLVYSDRNVSIWDCEKNELTILTREAWERMNEDQAKRRSKEE